MPNPTQSPAPRLATIIAFASLAASGTAVISWIVSAQLMSTPIADDYSWLHYASSLGPGGFFVWFLTGLTGRYSNAALMSISIGALGDLAIVIVPIALLILYSAGAIVLLNSVLGWLVPDGDKVVRAARAAALGVFFVAATLCALPSMFDSLIWFNSVCIFLASLAALVWLAVLWVKVGRHPRTSPLLLIALGASTFATQGFAETTGAVVIALSAIALITSFVRRWATRIRIVHTVVLVAGMAGLLTVFLLPGTGARNAIQDDLFPDNSFSKIIRGALHTGLIVTDIATTWRFVLVVGLGFGIWLAFRSRLATHRGLVLAAGALLAVGPVVATGLVTYITVQSEPYRTQTVAVVLSVSGMALMVAGLLSLLERVNRASLVLTIVAVVLGPVGAMSAAPALSTINQAVAVRQSLTDFRAISVRAQVAAGAPVIVVNPAPILLASSDSVEFSYNDIEVEWFERAFSNYFGLDGLTIQRDLTQPIGYCLATDRAAFPNDASVAVYFGARTCGQLVGVGTGQ